MPTRTVRYAVLSILLASGCGEQPVQPNPDAAPNTGPGDAGMALDAAMPEPVFCPGWSGTADPQPPEVEIVFPTSFSIAEAERITVRGTAFDADGIAEIRIDGQVADSADGFATWALEIALAEGDNGLSVTSVDSLGHVTEHVACASVARTGPYLDRPRELVWDPSNGRILLLTAGVLYSVSPSTGTLHRLTHSSGNVPFFHERTAMAWDPIGQQAYIAGNYDDEDDTEKRIAVVDPATGHETMLGSNGPSLGFVRSMIWDPVNARLLTVAYPEPRILAVDPATGGRALMSGESVGGGPAFADLTSLEWDPVGARVLVVDQELAALIAVDPASGDRTIISDADTGAGPALQSPAEVRWDSSQGRALVLDRAAPGTVYAVDMATGDRSALADSNSDGAERHLDDLLSILWDPAEQRLLALNREPATVSVIDPGTGAHALLSSSYLGAGPPLQAMSQLSLDAAGERLLVFDRESSALVSVHRADSQRAVVASAQVGSGPGISEMRGMWLDPESARVLLSVRANQLLWIDGDTGERTPFAAGDGVGPALSSSSLLIWDADEERALVIDVQQQAVIAVESATGDRVVVSDASSAGPALGNIMDATWDPQSRAIIALSWQGLMAIDVATGARTMLSDDATGSGEAFITPVAVAWNPATRTAIVADSHAGLLRVDGQTGDRALIAPVLGTHLPHFGPPDELALDWQRDLAFVASSLRPGMVFAVDLTTVERVIMTR